MSLNPRKIRRKQTEQNAPDFRNSIPGTRTAVYGDKGLVTVDLDSFGPEAQPKLWEEIIRRSGVPLFKGMIEHGYSKRTAGSTDQCPRCGAGTRQHTANFIYATNIATRAMLAPAGYFCTACPTVIVDEDFIAAGMKQGYRFRCVVGIDYGGKKAPDYFRTWNGKRPTYILDENQQIMDLATDDQFRLQTPPIHSRDRNKEKRRRRMAKQSRKRNRKRT